jgi:hypothetical protein
MAAEPSVFGASDVGPRRAALSEDRTVTVPPAVSTRVDHPMFRLTALALMIAAPALCGGCGQISYGTDLRTVVQAADGTVDVPDLASLAVYTKPPVNAVLRYTASGRGLKGTVAVLMLNGSRVAELSYDGKDAGAKDVSVALDLKDGENTLTLCTVVTGKYGGPISACFLTVHSDGRQGAVDAECRTNLNAERFERSWTITKPQ